ncbi:MAG: hypothetical protein ACXU9K_09075 [Thermodesulfobacteriota bacterium]
MRKILLFTGILFLLSAQLIQAQDDAFRYLDLIEKKYSGLRDYTTDVNVHFDIEALKAPDMQARLYFKSPDKLKVDSKRIFFFPKEGGFFNPFQFQKKNFEARVVDHLIYDSHQSVRLKLTPINTDTFNRGSVLTIDVERNLIRMIKILPSEGREIIAVIDYGYFGGFELPVHIGLQLDIPPSEAGGAKEFQFGKGGKRISGKVEITYSNYNVNSGLSDEIFTEKEFPGSKARPR